MPLGRRRLGAGRPPGTPNKRTAALARAVAVAAERLEMAIPDAFDSDAHALLVLVYKDPALPIELRLEAKAAVRFEKPAVSSVEARGRCGTSSSRTPPTADEWTAEVTGRGSA